MKQRIRILILFISHYFTHMRRKWKSLPLLLLFPFLIIGFLVVGLISFFIQPEGQPIQVGLVDHDQSEETELIISAFIEGTDLGEFIQVKHVDGNEAQAQIADGQLSAFLEFPEGFTSDLYRGNSVHIPVIGSENHKLESQFIYEFVQSIMRHIETAQANILTIYAYAEELPMDSEVRSDILFDEFTNYFFSIVNKDDILNQTEMQNKATFSPIMYFSIAALFFISIVWAFLFYLTLYRETSAELLLRMKLYGVHASQLVHSRLIVAYICSVTSLIGLFFLVKPFLFKQIDLHSTTQIIGLFALCIAIFIIGLAIIDLVSTSISFTFTIQLTFVSLCVLLSGAIIPRMYLPIDVQALLDSFFMTYTFDTLLHILIFDGIFISYQLLWITLGVGVVIYGFISFWKERIQR